MLVAVIFLLALFTIALAVALPKVSKEIQRDRDLETMQRGKQYARAVRLYYKKFNAYPPNVDALIKPTNNIRFLRKKYTDPTTGKEDWKPVRYGQNKAPMVMGFFGQPMGLSTMAGVGPSGAGGLPGGSSLPGVSSLGQQTPTPDPNAAQAQSTDTSNPAGGSTAASGSTTGSTSGSTTGSTSGSTTGSTSGSTTGSTTGLNGQTFGGGGIIGFSPNSPKQSILVYKKKNHYNEWEFVYDPIVEKMMQQGGNKGTIGQPASATTTPIGGTPTTTNNTTPTTTANPSPTTTTTSPQQ
jgi:type II secretory pathway pseudopilin PulG